MDNQKMIIGVDPDIDKSGFAILRNVRDLELHNKDFFQMITFIQDNKAEITKVVIEAGWLISKSNWHNNSNVRVASRVGKNVGENHAVGKLLECVCLGLGIKVQLLAPMGKKDAKAFARLTGYSGRTNQEQRDAGMLVCGMER